jgi:hypothetical protein
MGQYKPGMLITFCIHYPESISACITTVPRGLPVIVMINMHVYNLIILLTSSWKMDATEPFYHYNLMYSDEATSKQFAGAGRRGILYNLIHIFVCTKFLSRLIIRWLFKSTTIFHYYLGHIFCTTRLPIKLKSDQWA